MAKQPETKVLTPIFFWAQDMNRVKINISVANAEMSDVKLDITRDTLAFEFKNYELAFNFRFPVNPKTVKYKALRVLELVIEKDTSNAYWPHLLTKVDKKKLKNHCKIDWDIFMDEEEAKKREKGVFDEEDDGYGDLGDLNDSSGEDDSDDAPIADLEDNDDDDDDDAPVDDDNKKYENNADNADNTDENVNNDDGGNDDATVKATTNDDNKQVNDDATKDNADEANKDKADADVDTNANDANDANDKEKASVDAPAETENLEDID